MMKMFYQYGLFKPLVNVKLGEAATLRQFVPPAFVLFLIGGLIAPFLPVLMQFTWGAFLLFYILITLFVGLKIALSNSKFSLVVILPWLFPLIHISYGWGYLDGFIKLHLLHKKPGNQNFSTSR
jgi:hypothetical protein